MALFKKLLTGMFRSPAHGSNAPFHYKPGPVYNNEPALQAVFVSDRKRPPQDITGGGQRVRGQLVSLAGPLAYALKAVPAAGIGTIPGQYAVQMTTNPNGKFFHPSFAADAQEYQDVFQPVDNSKQTNITVTVK